MDTSLQGHLQECLTRLGGTTAVAWALSQGCSFHWVKFGIDYKYGRLVIQYRGCRYIDYGNCRDLESIVKQLRALWFPWLRCLCPWTCYINYSMGGQD